MHKKKKAILIIFGGIVLLFLVKLILDIPYRSNIPPLTDTGSLSASLQDQLKIATRNARLFPSSKNLGILGMVYHSSSNYEKASECYKLAVRKNRSKWIWSYYLGYLDKEMGESKNAVENFEKVIMENPRAFHAWYYIGEGYQDMGINDKAEIALKKIIYLKEKNSTVNTPFRKDYFPLSTYANYQLARLFLNTSRIEPAERILNEIIKDNQTFGSAYRMLGSVYRIMGDSLSSKNYINRANDLLDLTYPVDTLVDMLALRSRSDLYILKQIDEADKNRYPDWEMLLVNQALKYLPENKFVISKAIKLFLKMDYGEQALLYLDQHILYFNDDFEELKQVADLLYEKSYYSNSNIYYSRIIELQPENTEIQANLVLGLINEDKIQLGIDLMDEYLKKYSDNPKVLANAVYIMLLTRDDQQAENYLEKLRLIAPADPKTMLLGGRIAQQKGNLKQALVLYESAFKANPEDLLCVQTLGDVLMRQQLWNRAIDHFRKALDYFPNEPYILERIGTLLVACPDISMRNYIEGREYLERVFIHKACPDEIMIAAGRSLAEASAALGDKQKAALYMRFVMELAISNYAPKEFLDDLGKKLQEYNQ